MNPRPDRSAWTRTVRKAMKIQGLTQQKLAKALKISDRTLKNWFDDVHDPDPMKVGELAMLLKLNRLELFEQLGWVPRDEIAGRERVDLATNSLQLLDHFDSTIAVGPELIVRRALELGCETHVFIEQRVVDNIGSSPATVQIDYRAYIGVARHDTPLPDRTGQLTDRNSALFRQLEAVMRISPALIEDNPTKRAKYQALARAELWLWSPLVMATRRPITPGPLRYGIETILVVGDHGSGADVIAGLMARGLGWGQANTSFQAQRAYGRAVTDQSIHAVHCALVAEAYLKPMMGLNMVIGHGNPSTAPRVLGAIARLDHPAKVAVVYPRADTKLIEYGRRVWRDRPDSTQDASGRALNYQQENDEAIESLTSLDVKAFVIPVRLNPHVSLRTRPEDQEDVDLTNMHWAAYCQLDDWLRGNYHSIARM